MVSPTSRNAKKYYDKKAKGEKPDPKAKAAPDAKKKPSRKTKA